MPINTYKNITIGFLVNVTELDPNDLFKSSFNSKGKLPRKPYSSWCCVEFEVNVSSYSFPLHLSRVVEGPKFAGRAS